MNNLRAGAVALGLVALTVAIASYLAGDVVTAESPDESYEPMQLTRKEIEAFDSFDLLWVGESFEGLPLADVLRTYSPRQAGWPRGTNDVTFIYGTCDPGRDGRCMVPLQIQVWPACERNPASYSLTPDGRPLPHEPLTIRGVPAALYGDPAGIDGLEVYTGDITVVMFGADAGLLIRAAEALTAPNGNVAADEELSAPMDGALTGDLVCRPEVER